MEYEELQRFIERMESVLKNPQVDCYTKVTFQCPICGGCAVAIKFQECHGTGFCRECGIVCSE